MARNRFCSFYFAVLRLWKTLDFRGEAVMLCSRMDIRPPTWELKTDRCNYCGVGELIFSQCPACAVIIVICAECGTAYELQDQKRGKEVGDITGATRCHACGGPYQHEFPSASAEAIRSLGFSQEDYR
jgi:hypothetical protein